MLSSLRKEYKIVDGGVREGPFWVLAGAVMPSVLLEVGYITHPKEGKRLSQTKFQKNIAKGIADGVDDTAPGKRRVAFAAVRGNNHRYVVERARKGVGDVINDLQANEICHNNHAGARNKARRPEQKHGQNRRRDCPNADKRLKFVVAVFRRAVNNHHQEEIDEKARDCTKRIDKTDLFGFQFQNIDKICLPVVEKHTLHSRQEKSTHQKDNQFPRRHEFVEFLPSLLFNQSSCTCPLLFQNQRCVIVIYAVIAGRMF